MNTMDPDEMLLQADQAIDANDMVRARAILTQLISEYPDYGRAHNHLGWLNERKLRYFSKAEEHYKAGLRFAPDYPATWINYGYFLAMEERYDELEKHLFQALKVKGIAKSFIYQELANMYECKMMYPEAIEYYNKSIINSLDDEKIKIYQASLARVVLKQNLDL